ncbi:hypothetical protein Agub_g6305 [Astrephomene gubernaculifera]|uniref:Uncharacterized protein n=1 Tax=Astrephomene gubernaculifera TaxID=47775 RepID=A0AAD3DN84_9CHLO|nr:hypothetical protein Agub_g6305 [Astrephomene gubernaculifera]
MLALQPAAPTVSKMTAPVHSANCGMGSLVFDCEVEERLSTAAVPPAVSAAPLRSSKEKLNQDRERLVNLSLPTSTYAWKLLRDVRYFLKEERDTDAILLATKLSAVGYNVVVRTALGGGPACFRNLRHEFLTVRGQGDFEGTEFIVEPQFREHFSIPHPTEEYSELLSAAPDVYVGASARLVPIVQTLCALMAESFEARGLTLPPWRRTQSMLSKWLPNRVRDTCFARASAPAGTVNGSGGSDDTDPNQMIQPSCSSSSSVLSLRQQQHQQQQQRQQQQQLPVATAAAAVTPAAANCGVVDVPFMVSETTFTFLRLSDPLQSPSTPKAPCHHCPSQQPQQQPQQDLQQYQQQPPCCQCRPAGPTAGKLHAGCSSSRCGTGSSRCR